MGQRDHAERLEGIAGYGAGAQDLSWDLVFFRGRRCPRGNRGLRSLLKPCWLPRDINSSLAARPGVPSWVPGPGRRQAQTLRPLLGEQRGLLVHCPPSGSHRSFSQRPLRRLCRACLIIATPWTQAQLAPPVQSPRGPMGISTWGLLPTQMPGPRTLTSSKSLAKETMGRSYWPSTSLTGCSTQ